MRTETIVFPHPGTNLKSLANKYTPTNSAFSLNGVTFILAHCVSSHKEVWETTIARLFDICGSSCDPRHRIREVWSIEWQSHGESGLINEDVLKSRSGVTVAEYGDLLGHFVRSSHVTGHRVIPVGFSGSTSAWALTTATLASPFSFGAMIFIEPVLLIGPILPNDSRIEKGQTNIKAVLSRPEKWNTLIEASNYFYKHYPWKIWDRRIVESYIAHALHETTVEDGTSIVRLKCTLAQEKDCYKHEEHFDAGAQLARICASVPLHCVFGERPEMITIPARNMICDTSMGHVMASISTVPKAGHLIVQEKPEGVATRLVGVMDTLSLPTKANL